MVTLLGQFSVPLYYEYIIDLHLNKKRLDLCKNLLTFESKLVLFYTIDC